MSEQQGAAQAAALDLSEPQTQDELRQWAFAKRVLEVVDVAAAYRDVFAPGQDVEAYHYAAGNRLLKKVEVGKLIKQLAPPALVAAGVDRDFALRRLIQTVDGDVTDYATVEVDEEGNERSGFMSLAQIKKLPLEKRRLIKRYVEVFDKDGKVRRREIELEPKQPAIDLLARIQQWVQPNQLNVTNSETIINVITVAQKAAERRAAALRDAAGASRTAQQMTRSAGAQVAVAALIEHSPQPIEPDAPT